MIGPLDKLFSYKTFYNVIIFLTDLNKNGIGNSYTGITPINLVNSQKNGWKSVKFNNRNIKDVVGQGLEECYKQFIRATTLVSEVSFLPKPFTTSCNRGYLPPTGRVMLAILAWSCFSFSSSNREKKHKTVIQL